MIELSKEKPYEDACKLLGLRPVANYKSYKLTDETRQSYIGQKKDRGYLQNKVYKYAEQFFF